jgi:hypothetical protein
LTAAMKSPAVGGSIPSLATTITKSEFIGRASVVARSAEFLTAAMESPAVGGSIPSLATTIILPNLSSSAARVSLRAVQDF